MSTKPVALSNEVEDFVAAGIYPGGTGKVIEFRYKLWDYDGQRPPDSQCAAYLQLQPTDGSNDNKPVDCWWSVGPATEFSPDDKGGRILSLKGRTALSDNSNWAFFLKKLRDTCGLEKGKLSSDDGIRVMEGAEMTLARVDQPHRDFEEDKLPGEEKKGRKRTMLVPTRATFSWEGKGKSAAAAAKPSTSASRATMGAAPSSSNGAGDMTTAVDNILKANGGSFALADLPKALLGELSNMDRAARMEIIKSAKDPAAIEELALANDWKFDGTTISV